MANEYLGKDIKLSDENDIQFSNSQDFFIINDVENLAQAISNRLSTIKGEYKLTSFYGSELNQDLGLPNSGFIISGLKGHVVECLNQEPRIKTFTINDITMGQDRVNVDLTIVSIKTNKIFNMVYPYYLEE